MRKIIYWLPSLVWMGFIFFLSSRTRVQVSDIYSVQFIIFKSLHIIEYATLYVLLYRSLKNTSSEPDWKNRFNAFLYAVVYGISDEIHQVFVPTREGTMRDIIIDSIGATMAFFIIWKYLPRAPKRLKIWAKKLDIL